MFSRLKSTLIVLALFTMILSACGNAASPSSPATTNTQAAVNTSVSFAKDVMPILESRCLSCHGGQQTQRGLSVASYETLMAGSDNGPVIIPGDPSNSLLIQMIQAGKMPKRGPKLTPDQLQTLIDWITTGALNN
jgi:uncharacterized membrane protein